MRNQWLKDRLAELRPGGKSAAGLAKALGLAKPRISEIISGNRNVQSSEITRMATYLEWPEPVLLDHIAPGTRRAGSPIATPRLQPVKIIGFVQAGVWRESVECPVDEQSYVYADIDHPLAGINLFALRVIGPSMNRLYPEGTVLICAKAGEFGEGFAFRSEDKVIVQRRNQDGLFETTVKEYVIQPDGRRFLWPRSDDPDHQQPWPVPDGEPDDASEDPRILALVVSITRSEIAPGRLHSP
jgi:SOS-response transcriptional repressor LexA